MSSLSALPAFLRHAALLARLSGLLHDLGKASAWFQSKLRAAVTGGLHVKDEIRHEWISAWLVQQLALDTCTPDDLARAWLDWGTRGQAEVRDDRNPWMPAAHSATPLQAALEFCVATHHQLFDGGTSAAAPAQHRASAHVTRTASSQKALLGEFALPPDELSSWTPLFDEIRETYRAIASVRNTPTPENHDYWKGIALIARAALVLGDHSISSLDYPTVAGAAPAETSVWANTRDAESGRGLNQPLLWHLLNVAQAAHDNVPCFLGEDLPCVSAESLAHLVVPTANPRFFWQNTAYDYLRTHRASGPSLIFNVAGVGAGKTRGNLKALAGARGEQLRITAGFNLRTLTMQTRDAFQASSFERSEVACVLGSALAVRLHESALACDVEADARLELDAIDWEPSLPLPDWLNTLHSSSPAEQTRLKKLLGAPVLVSTMDQVIAGGEPGKQARHAHSLLRVTSSDLIIDEADSYDPVSFMAVLRVIEMAAMFGRHIVLSSATLSQELAAAVHQTWLRGAKRYEQLTQQAMGSVFHLSDSVAPARHAAALWSEKDYTDYVAQIAARALELPTYKMARVVDIAPNGTVRDLYKRIATSALTLHESNHETVTVETPSGPKKKRVSIGLVRMAKVNPCLAVAKYLQTSEVFPENTRVIVTAYHAKDVLARRTFKERQLDKLLHRAGGAPWWQTTGKAPLLPGEQSPWEAIESYDEQNILFIVVATPVEEVGRDHDFDWGIIEPSSLSSILQTAGRINRHRLIPVTSPNIHILNRTVASLDSPKGGGAAYRYPGFQHAERYTDTRNNTHWDAATNESALAADLLGHPIDPKTRRSEPFALNASLAFGAHRCRFALEDAKGLRRLIQPALDAMTNPRTWMNNWLYTQYPLRANTTSFTYAYREEKPGSWKLMRKVSPTTPGAAPSWSLVCPNPVAEVPAGYWLCPPAKDVISYLAASLGFATKSDTDELGSIVLQKISPDISLSLLGLHQG